jgi:hypothetical protein
MLRGGASITFVQTPEEGYLTPTCGTQNAEATLGGWSGANANLMAPYTTTGC